MVAGANASYGNDYQDAAALKELADRCNVCLLVIHHLRKMPDEDPFNRLSGTNGLTGAADGTIILIRQKRQEGTALLTATGRDIEDRELTLEFSDCCWSRSCSPDELQLMYLLPAIRQLLGLWRVSRVCHRVGGKAGTTGLLMGSGPAFPVFAKPQGRLGGAGNFAGHKAQQPQTVSVSLPDRK